MDYASDISQVVKREHDKQMLWTFKPEDFLRLFYDKVKIDKPTDTPVMYVFNYKDPVQAIMDRLPDRNIY